MIERRTVQHETIERHRREPAVRRPRLDREPPQRTPPAEATIDGVRRSPPITVTHHEVVDGDLATELWTSYRANFEPLAELAILQHYYDEAEIREEFENPRIDKIIVWQDGAPVGLGMVTNSLEDVPQISPRFLRRRYPEHAARDAIYFGILVMVSTPQRGLTIFSRLYTELWQVPARAGGVLVFDICEFNRELFDTDALAARIASQFPGGSVSVLDRQTWYVADLPAPIPAEAVSQRRQSERAT